MFTAALLVLAQGSPTSQEAPDSGSGVALIVGAVLAILLVLALLFLLVSRRSRASKGGVEPVPGSREPGAAPLESIERDR